MQNTMFHQSGQQGNRDRVARLLHVVAQSALVVVLGLIPLLFLPVSYAPFNYSKTFFVLIGVVIALIFFSLSVLRDGELSLSVPPALGAMWGLVAAYAVSTLFSGDIKDSLIGDGLEVHTAAFVAFLVVTTSAVTILRGSKISIVRLYALLIISGIALALFHIARILFGVEFLSLGMFGSLVSSPLGSWNGLALFFGLVLLISMVAIEQLPLTVPGKVLLGASAVLALIMLAIVNFFEVWVVLGIVSLVVLIYGLTRKHYRTTDPLLTEETDNSFASSILATAVFIMSLLFVLGGTSLGTAISGYTGISYVEVRPSFTATFDIAREVLNSSPVVGIGPNKFMDAWRLYKDPSINQTIFWNTNFDSGSGFIPSSFVMTGLLGTLAWAAFFILVLVHGFKMFFQSPRTDRFWTFIGTSSFIGTVYLWGMAFVYTPPAAILILAAVCTGIFFSAYGILIPQRRFTISVLSNRAFGFMLVGLVVVVIFSSVGTLYAVGQHYSSVYSFSKTFATITEGDTIETVEERIAAAYDRSSNDIFARQIAQYRFAQTNALLNVANPQAEQQQLFQEAVTEGVRAAQIATELDATEPQNWQVLGQFYSALAFAGVDGAATRAREAYDRAQSFDPENPTIYLLKAQLASRSGDLDEARRLAEEAVAKKRDYTEALLFLSQLDIVQNDVEAAIGRTASIISIEPNNPARHYQMGVLESASGDSAASIAAFQRAIALDTNYANARYLLALEYAKVNEPEAALQELRVVESLNRDNPVVKELIRRIENNEPILLPQEGTAGIESGENSIDDGEAVTSSTISETNLVKPVNVVPESAASTTETTTE